MLLEVENLVVSYTTPGGVARAVDGVDLVVEQGRSIGMVGESGCGKTTLARALLRILPANGCIEGGRIRLDGIDLVRATDRELRKIRWRRIALIPQSAMNALNPVFRVGDQIIETIRAHDRVAPAAARRRAVELFEQVGVEPSRLDDYPHQFSGGMRQRVAIAMACALRPALIIADEPTTALDVLVQERILSLLERLRLNLGLTLLYITHDVPVVAHLCDAVIVMYAGRVVESGPVSEVFRAPCHPYTMGLLKASPHGWRDRRDPMSIPGSPPSLITPPAGCRFAPRCPFVADRCVSSDPGLSALSAGHRCACHFAHEGEAMRRKVEAGVVWGVSG